MPRWLTLALQVAVSLALLVALIAIVDWTQLREAAAALSLGAIVVVCLCCLGTQVSLVLRWRALLDMLGVRESWLRSWHSVFAGLFLTNFLPGTLGSDGLRVVLLTKACGRASTAIGAVAYERLMQLALYVLLASLAALLPMPWLQPWLRMLIVAAGAVGIGFLVFILYWLGQRSAQQRRPRWPAADGVAPVRHHPDRDRPHADAHAPPSPRRARLLGGEHRQRRADLGDLAAHPVRHGR